VLPYTQAIIEGVSVACVIILQRQSGSLAVVGQAGGDVIGSIGGSGSMRPRRIG